MRIDWDLFESEHGSDYNSELNLVWNFAQLCGLLVKQGKALSDILGKAQLMKHCNEHEQEIAYKFEFHPESWTGVESLQQDVDVEFYLFPGVDIEIHFEFYQAATLYMT